MPDFTITVSTVDAKIIQHIATKSNRTGRQLVEGLVANWCSGQLDGYFVRKLSSMTTSEKIELLGDIT